MNVQLEHSTLVCTYYEGCIFIAFDILEQMNHLWPIYLICLSTVFVSEEMAVPISGNTLFVANNFFAMSLWNVYLFLCWFSHSLHYLQTDSEELHLI